MYMINRLNRTPEQFRRYLKTDLFAGH